VTGVRPSSCEMSDSVTVVRGGDAAIVSVGPRNDSVGVLTNDEVTGGGVTSSK
jgi:hypothetical protein